MKKKEITLLDMVSGPPGKILVDDEGALGPSISLLEVMQAPLPIPRLFQPIS